MQKYDQEEKPEEIVINTLAWSRGHDKYVICPSGHVTQMFLACDPQSACWANQIDVSTTACDYRGTPPPPSMKCLTGVDHVPYTLVCDHRPDCSDNSDENFCVFPLCHLSGMFQCTNKQCVPFENQCDRMLHCLDGSDERRCPLYDRAGMKTPKPPAIIHFDGHGSYQVQSIDSHSNGNNSHTDICPETHFMCARKWAYCMPVFVRCNGVYDCPGREDEEGCDRYQCPGFYRCRTSTICVHANHTCDGIFHCPQHDDELFCDTTCPQNCACQGLAFYCKSQFPAEDYQKTRFLHAPQSAHWNFYSQNGICIPLPITRNDFAGHDYSFSVMIIVNFILFLLIAVGQIFIYWSVHTNSMTIGDSNKQSNDITIARRLITIAVSDFLCWFPIGLLGLLASSGVPVPGEVNVAIAILVLPVNAAINPFLYTINMLFERRRKAHEKRIKKMLMSTLAIK
ncbi:uncharacterized protein LOC143296589 [Babylonia areolata]|uniref:uncharacterized protein LOC143296589 n=1 Tax=Babylonia areolata TaxID=304850 RepID=UPI003FD319C1